MFDKLSKETFCIQFYRSKWYNALSEIRFGQVKKFNIRFRIKISEYIDLVRSSAFTIKCSPCVLVISNRLQKHPLKCRHCLTLLFWYVFQKQKYCKSRNPSYLTTTSNKVTHFFRAILHISSVYPSHIVNV